jgi:hypothetical protein
MMAKLSGKIPVVLLDLNAPRKTSSSAMNPENPGKPSEAKNAISTMVVYDFIFEESPE